MIENIELLAYIRDNISFCRTLVIKYEDIARLDNLLIKRSYGVDAGTDKSKWRYYMNLSGEYHFSDEMMTVKSLDDRTVINFTKENLELHPATRSAYRTGGYYYSRLADQYAHQRDLINGIINPIPKDEAIAARDFKILRYTTDYVLWNEISLVPELQKWIDNVAYQTFSTEYKYTDDLMSGALLSYLHDSMIKFVQTFRYERRNSRYAHSFWIWSRLQSEGISPIYKSVLNEKQTMWLFRNIDYVLRNLGKEDTFNQLMDVLLTDREIPLSKYDMVYDTENMPEDLTPTAKYLTRRLNMTERLGLGESLREISMTMMKEIPDAIDNEVLYEKMLPVTTDETDYGEASNYPIKVLESEMTDTTNRQPETLFHVMNAELIYLAKHDMYDIQINFTESLTGNQYMMNVSECIVVWHYLLSRWLGEDPVDIPEFIYNKALKITPPTVEELMALSGHPFLERDWCTDLRKTQVPQFRIVSPTAFHNNAKAVFDLKWTHKKMVARFPSIGHYSRRANAASTMYETGFARLTDYKTYPEILTKFGLDFKDYSREDCVSMMWEIWQKMTGWNLFDHQTIAQVQNGMIGLMRFLSSYSVQYIKQTEVQDGYFQGGLELMTENPMNLRGDGPMPEQESELETNRIPVHLRVVTEHEIDMIYIGTIDQVGFEVEAELGMHGQIFETPLLYPLEDQDSVFELTGGHMEVLRETTNLPWDIEDLIPKGELSPQYTNGLIVDTLVGEIQAGPWKAVGVEIVDNGIDNEIVAHDVGGIPVDQYAEFYEGPNAATSGANSPKSIGASFVDNKAHYDIGFVPGQLGEGVVKFDLIAEHEDTGELIRVRFQHNVTIDRHTWVNTYEIPESVTLNSEFPITPTITGLDLTGGDLKGLTFKLANGLDEWLTLRQDDTGALFGTFIKAGWPETLYALTCANIKPTGQVDDKHTGEKFRYMLGLIPSDRYYDPIKDPDFIPKVRVREADIKALVYDDFTVISEKKGWRVTGVEFKNSEKNKNVVGRDYTTDYGVMKDFIKPVYERPTVFEEDGKQYKKWPFWWASQEMGKNHVEMITRIINDETKETLEVPWIMETTTYDHGITNTYASYPPNGELPINITTDCNIIITNMIMTVGLDMRVELINNDPNHPVGYDFSRNGFNGVTIVGLKVTPSGQVSNDVGFGLQIRVYPKRINSTELLYCRHYANFGFKKEIIFDPNDFTIDELGFVPWEVNAWRVNELIFDRLLVKERVKGWYVESIEHAKGETGEYLTENIRTKYSNGDVLYDIPAPPPEVLMRTGTDDRVALPADYRRVYGIGAVPTAEGSLGVKLKVVLSNAYLGKNAKTEIFTHNVNVLPDVFGMSIDPTIIIRKGEKQVDYITTGYPLEDEAPNWVWNSDTGFFPGMVAYSDTDVITNGAEKNFKFPVFNRSLKEPGIGIALKSRYVHKTRTAANSVAWYQEYYTFSGFQKDDVLDVYPPTLEDLGLKAENDGVDWFKDVTSSALVTYNSESIYAMGNWIVNPTLTKLTAWGAENQDEILKTHYDEFDFSSTMYGMAVQTLPTGHEKGRAGIYPKFTPVQLGKQKYTLEVVVTSSLTSRRYSFFFDFELEIKEIEVPVYFENEDQLWYPLGKIVTAKMIFDIPASSHPINTKRLPYAKEYFAFTNEIKASVGSSVSSTVKINVLERPNPDHIANIVGFQNVVYTNFILGDPRSAKVFYGKAGIDTSRIYDTGEIDAGIFDFQPDVTFPEKLRYQVYTERWLYNLLPRGWYINSIGYDGDRPKEVMYEYEQDGSKYEIPVLNRFLHTKTVDNAIPAPDGKNFMFPVYGLNVAGELTLKLKINIIGSYHTGRKDIFLDLDAKAIESGIDFTQNFKDDVLRIGEINDYILTTTAIPPADKLEWVIGTSTIFNAVGKSANLLTLDAVNRKVTVPPAYPGDTAKFVYGIQYAGVSSTLVPPDAKRSDTWNRIVVTDDIFDVDKFVPSETLFNPVVAKEATLLAKAVNNVRFYVNSDIGDWTVTRLGMKGGSSTTQPDVTLDYNGDVMPWMYSESKWPSVVPVDGVLRNAFLVGFVPTTVGDKTYKMEFEVTNSHGATRTIEFDYNVTVYGVADVLVDQPTSSAMYINTPVTKNIRPFGWTIAAGATQGYSGSYPFGVNKGNVTVEQIGTVLGAVPNTRFTFLSVSDHDFEFLATATVKQQYVAATDLIDDGNGALLYYGDYLIDKALVRDSDDISGFTPTPDLVYGTYQPYEDVVDRYTIPITYNGWTLKSADYQAVVGKEMAFTGFTGKPVIARPKGWLREKTDDTTLKYLYLELCPLTAGSQSYPVDIVVENASGVQKTLTFMDVRAVQARTSSMTIPEKTFKSGYTTTFPFTFIDHPAARLGAGLDVAGCIVESLDGLKDGEALSYRLYGRDMTVTLNYTRTEDARYYVRWSYFWTTGPRAGDNEMRNISYYSEIDIKKESVTDGNIFDPTEFTITPDLLYDESHPYEQQTDRFVTSTSVGPWDIVDGQFDPSVVSDGKAFTKFDNGPVIATPTVVVRNNNNAAKTSSLYFSVVPLIEGDIIFPVILNFKNRVTNETATLRYDYVKHVVPRRSWLRMTLNEFQANADNITELYSDNTPGYTARVGPGNGMNGWYAEGGFNSPAKSGETFNYDWSSRINPSLNANRGEDAVFWIRKVFYWPEISDTTNEIDPRGIDDYMSNLVYYNKLVIPQENIRTDFISKLSEYFQWPKTDANGELDTHYLNEAIHLTKPEIGPKDIPQREDFQLSNKWTVKEITETNLEDLAEWMDREYIFPYFHYVEDDKVLNIRFSPKMKPIIPYQETIKYTIMIQDDYKNNRYVPLEYPYKATDRGAKITTPTTNLVTGVETPIKLTRTNVPAFSGNGYTSKVRLLPPAGREENLITKVDSVTGDGSVISRTNFDETSNTYLIVEDRKYPSGSELAHYYFSRLPLAKSEVDNTPPYGYSELEKDPAILSGSENMIKFTNTLNPDGTDNYYPGWGVRDGLVRSFNSSFTDEVGDKWNVTGVAAAEYNTSEVNYVVRTSGPLYFLNVTSFTLGTSTASFNLRYLAAGDTKPGNDVVCTILLNVKNARTSAVKKVVLKYVAKPKDPSLDGLSKKWIDCNIVLSKVTPSVGFKVNLDQAMNPTTPPRAQNAGEMNKDIRRIGTRAVDSMYDITFDNSTGRFWTIKLTSWPTGLEYTETWPAFNSNGRVNGVIYSSWGCIMMYKSEDQIPEDRKDLYTYVY